MANVSLKNVTKQFGDASRGNAVLAVKNLDLNAADGEFLVLLGPSGCGKTTTLRMVAGLERATAGEIFIGSRSVNEMPPGDRDIAFVFQFYALYPHLSVRDNISFPLRAQNVPADEVQRRVKAVASRLKIEHILNKRPNRLPSGEQQRVALGRAMVRQPQVFLMDEPLTNLDASLRAEMRVELKHLQQELKTTMLYVTHDQVEAMSMSHRIAIMNQGLLQQVGTPIEVYNHPKTLFVATFIGSPPMNTVACKLSENSALSGSENSFRLSLDEGLASRVRSIGDLVFGVRSEDIRLIGSGEDGADLRGIVTVREPLGDETVYQIDLGGYHMLAKTPPRQVFRQGEQVGLAINRKRIHLFDRQSGQAVI